jgi:hypothetical protein
MQKININYAGLKEQQKDLKELKKDIEKAKKKCIKQFQKKGAFEHFGYKECSELKEKWIFKNCALSYGDIHNELVVFYEWAGYYNG